MFSTGLFILQCFTLKLVVDIFLLLSVSYFYFSKNCQHLPGKLSLHEMSCWMLLTNVYIYKYTARKYEFNVFRNLMDIVFLLSSLM
jgi:hypothetical protein